MKPGDKVVCVDDAHFSREHHKEYNYSDVPVKGRIYVIRNVRPSPATGELGLNLVGIYADIRWMGVECGFKAKRFRLLDDMKAEAAKQYQAAEAFESRPLQPTKQHDKTTNQHSDIIHDGRHNAPERQGQSSVNATEQNGPEKHSHQTNNVSETHALPTSLGVRPMANQTE